MKQNNQGNHHFDFNCFRNSVMAVRLAEYPIKFPPLLGSQTGVYFDDANKQIFVTRDGHMDIDVISIAPYSETFIRYEEYPHGC